MTYEESMRKLGNRLDTQRQIWRQRAERMEKHGYDAAHLRAKETLYREAVERIDAELAYIARMNDPLLSA